MKINIRSNFNLFLTIGVVLMLIGFYFYENFRIEETLKRPKFTVGKISSEFHHQSTFKTFGNDYFYYVQRFKFTGVAKNCRFKSVGDKFLVIFDSKNPNNFSVLFCFYPIPDSVQAPLDGWTLEELPIEVDMQKIEDYMHGK